MILDPSVYFKQHQGPRPLGRNEVVIGLVSVQEINNSTQSSVHLEFSFPVWKKKRTQLSLERGDVYLPYVLLLHVSYEMFKEDECDGLICEFCIEEPVDQPTSVLRSLQRRCLLSFPKHHSSPLSSPQQKHPPTDSRSSSATATFLLWQDRQPNK